MALAISSSAQNKLKDYLLDDIGSCSSSGFRSFPRRQCCIAVRSLIDVELHRRRRRSSSMISSVIRKASTAIVSAVKLLRFKSPGTGSCGIGKRRLLQKEVSKRRDSEIEWWISNAAATVEKPRPLDHSTSSSNDESRGRGDSWSESDSEFTLTCSSLDENGVVRSSSVVSKRSCRRLIVGGGSTDTATTKNNWIDEKENEKLSPVSVLNFPDDGEKTASSSPITRRLNHLEGTKEKLMQKLRRFECLSRIDPTNIESRLSPTITSNEESPVLSYQSSPSPQQIVNPSEDDETEDMAAKHLLNLIKAKTIVSTNAYKLNTDGLLVGFFLEGLTKGKGENCELVEETLLKEAEDWLVGICHKEKRKAYVKDMKESRVWRSYDVEKEELVVQVEAQVLASLVDEMVEGLIRL